MKTISAGVILFDSKKSVLFLAHVTGQRHWDIPKGGIDVDERAIEAAIRELREETGISLTPSQLVDLGEFKYNPKKDLHLFFSEIDSSTILCEHCVCTSFFENKIHQQVPEVDSFEWKLYPGALTFVVPNLQKILADVLNTRLHRGLTSESLNF